MAIQRIHHVAYRCTDAKRTVEFYRDNLDMAFKLAFAENQVPSTGEPDPYMHVFLDAGGGNVLAFFELPNSPPLGRDENTPNWVQHIAFELNDLAEMESYKLRLEANGIDVLGPINHGIFDSIYFFDPDGHRLEFAVNKGTKEQFDQLKSVAGDMLEEWSITKRAPRHADWLHASPSPDP
ncbi:MAG: VOC family protein [Gammaproteobacteria bacterium]|nr:VOC family protein [Gammaproteobacteria bacterium]